MIPILKTQISAIFLYISCRYEDWQDGLVYTKKWCFSNIWSNVSTSASQGFFSSLQKNQVLFPSDSQRMISLMGRQVSFLCCRESRYGNTSDRLRIASATLPMALGAIAMLSECTLHSRLKLLSVYWFEQIVDCGKSNARIANSSEAVTNIIWALRSGNISNKSIGPSPTRISRNIISGETWPQYLADLHNTISCAISFTSGQCKESLPPMPDGLCNIFNIWRSVLSHCMFPDYQFNFMVV